MSNHNELHRNLCTVAEEMGRLEGNTRDLESRAKKLAARNTALNFERIKNPIYSNV